MIWYFSNKLRKKYDLTAKRLWLYRGKLLDDKGQNTVKFYYRFGGAPVVYTSKMTKMSAYEKGWEGKNGREKSKKESVGRLFARHRSNGQ